MKDYQFFSLLIALCFFGWAMSDTIAKAIDKNTAAVESLAREIKYAN